jgi:hypothetical protein
MPVVDWGISKGVMDDFDREKQELYKPYTGPKPPAGVYRWRIDQMLYKADDGGERLPQWLALLVLVPRFASAFAYTPLCDVLGISEREFRTRFKTDSEGKVISIGRWRMDGKQEILAEIVDNWDENSGKLYTNVRWVGDVSEDQSTLDNDESDEDDDYENDEDEFDEVEDDDEEEETPKRRPAKRTTKAAPRKAASRRSRRSTVEDDDF